MTDWEISFFTSICASLNIDKKLCQYSFHMNRTNLHSSVSERKSWIVKIGDFIETMDRIIRIDGTHFLFRCICWSELYIDFVTIRQSCAQFLYHVCITDGDLIKTATHSMMPLHLSILCNNEGDRPRGSVIIHKYTFKIKKKNFFV